mmetsp:Transcript_2029/g.3237  ORF Transcript_2029/g.3237 Transcript_2029/m.3237 type:complete len:324 (-) Transcript_2029:711-1682(-)
MHAHSVHSTDRHISSRHSTLHICTRHMAGHVALHVATRYSTTSASTPRPLHPILWHPTQVRWSLLPIRHSLISRARWTSHHLHRREAMSRPWTWSHSTVGHHVVSERHARPRTEWAWTTWTSHVETLWRTAAMLRMMRLEAHTWEVFPTHSHSGHARWHIDMLGHATRHLSWTTWAAGSTRTALHLPHHWHTSKHVHGAPALIHVKGHGRRQQRSRAHFHLLIPLVECARHSHWPRLVVHGRHVQPEGACHLCIKAERIARSVHLLRLLTNNSLLLPLPVNIAVFCLRHFVILMWSLQLLPVMLPLLPNIAMLWVSTTSVTDI